VSRSRRSCSASISAGSKPVAFAKRRGTQYPVVQAAAPSSVSRTSTERPSCALRPSPTATPPLALVMDRYDDAAYTHTALAAPAPAAGRHPSGVVGCLPGTLTPLFLPLRCR
jgi:hypothetical protein